MHLHSQLLCLLMSVCGLHSQLLHLYFLASQQVHTFLVSLYVEEKKNSQWNSSFIDSSSTGNFFIFIFIFFLDMQANQKLKCVHAQNIIHKHSFRGKEAESVNTRRLHQTKLLKLLRSLYKHGFTMQNAVTSQEKAFSISTF